MALGDGIMLYGCPTEGTAAYAAPVGPREQQPQPLYPVLPVLPAPDLGLEKFKELLVEARRRDYVELNERLAVLSARVDEMYRAINDLRAITDTYLRAAPTYVRKSRGGRRPGKKGTKR